MLFLSIINIVLRWFEHSILWIEPLVRHLVFMAAFLGGSLATGASQHIKIDLVSKILERNSYDKLNFVVEKLVVLFSLTACLVLVYASYHLFLVEKEYGQISFLEIHSSYLVGIIPVGMGLISLRFLLNLFMIQAKEE